MGRDPRQTFEAILPAGTYRKDARTPNAKCCERKRWPLHPVSADALAALRSPLSSCIPFVSCSFFVGSPVDVRFRAAKLQKTLSKLLPIFQDLVLDDPNTAFDGELSTVGHTRLCWQAFYLVHDFSTFFYVSCRWLYPC